MEPQDANPPSDAALSVDNGMSADEGMSAAGAESAGDEFGGRYDATPYAKKVS